MESCLIKTNIPSPRVQREEGSMGLIFLYIAVTINNALSSQKFSGNNKHQCFVGIYTSPWRFYLNHDSQMRNFPLLQGLVTGVRITQYTVQTNEFECFWLVTIHSLVIFFHFFSELTEWVRMIPLVCILQTYN